MGVRDLGDFPEILVRPIRGVAAAVEFLDHPTVVAFPQVRTRHEHEQLGGGGRRRLAQTSLHQGPASCPHSRLGAIPNIGGWNCWGPCVRHPRSGPHLLWQHVGRINPHAPTAVHHLVKRVGIQRRHLHRRHRLSGHRIEHFHFDHGDKGRHSSRFTPHAPPQRRATALSSNTMAPSRRCWAACQASSLAACTVIKGRLARTPPPPAAIASTPPRGRWRRPALFFPAQLHHGHAHLTNVVRRQCACLRASTGRTTGAWGNT